MPSKGDEQINSFNRGLITEATDLSFPLGASLDEVNMDLLRSGARQRRLGLDYEDNYTLHGTGLTAEQIQTSRQRVFVWPTPSGSNKVEIGVVQIGTYLYFINLFAEAPSSALLNGGSSLDASLVSTIIDNNALFDFAIINNNLMVVSEGLDTPFLLAYDDSSDTINYATAPIKIRDLYGVADSLSDNERPTTLSDSHKYNLRNQGWNENIVTTCGTEVLQCTFDTIGSYPSNSDTWSLGKIADVTSADIDKYDPETLKRNSFDLGRAARGHFIIDLYNRGQSRTDVSGIPVSKIDREIGRISTITSLGGRIFYSGIRSRVLESDASPKLSGAVLFSQIASNNVDLVKCYQEADPTSPTSSDIVDTDGGIIFITEAANIVELRTIKSSVFVFADNGVWEIRGDEGGFRATSFQVNKVSSIGVLSRESIVEANGTIFFWAKEGIFALTPNQLGTGYDTTNLSIDTIQTAYNTIPSITKTNAKGYYDVSKNRVRWLFNSEETIPIGVEDPDPPITSFGAASLLVENRQQPMIAMLGNDRAFVAYRNSGSINTLYYVIATVNSDLTIDVTSEQTELSGTQIATFNVVDLTTNKFLLVYKYTTSSNTYAKVGNVSGDTVTFTSPTVIDTTHTGDLTRSIFDLTRIDANKVVLAAKNIDNSKVGLQVIQIDASDNITFGSVYKSSWTNTATPRVTMLTSTSGIVGSAGLFTNVSATIASFSVSGTVITINTSAAFTNTSQWPSGTHQFFLGDIRRLSNTQAVCIGGSTTVVSSVTTHGVESFVIATGSPPTSTTTLLDSTTSTWSSSPTTIFPRLGIKGNKYYSLLQNVGVSPRSLHYALYNAGTPSTKETNGDVDTASATMEHIYVEELNDDLLLSGYTKNDGTVSIQLLASRIN